MAGDPGSEASVRAALDGFDLAFAAGDAEVLTRLFAPEGVLLLQFGAALSGRDEIHGQWSRLFTRFDTSAWQTERLVVDVHGDAAYTVSTYTEILVPREGAGASERVVGRLVLFLRRDPVGAWLVTLALNSHVRPVEPV